MVPTEFGHTFLKRSIAVFDELRHGIAELRYLADPGAGELRMGASEYMAAGLVAAVINRLSQRYPNCLFKIELDDAIGQLRERKLEFVVTRLLSRQIDSDLDAETLFYEQVFVAAGPANKWAARRKLSLSALRDEPWILAPPEIEEDSPIATAFRAIGSVMPQTTVLGLSLPLRNGLLATGRFLTIVPGSVLTFGAERMLLRKLPVALPSWHLPVAIITLKNRTLSPLAQSFIGELRHTAKPLSKRPGL
jgi:DNA-binding transcriptional LysR family regulator